MGIYNIGYSRKQFVFRKVLTTFCVSNVLNAFWSLQISLLCIVGDLAGEGYVAVAVAVSDK